MQPARVGYTPYAGQLIHIYQLQTVKHQVKNLTEREVVSTGLVNSCYPSVILCQPTLVICSWQPSVNTVASTCNYTVSQKTSHLYNLLLFLHTVWLRQFLAQMLPRKQEIKMYFIFQPQLTSASALPGETGNPEIASFHLNVACFFTKKHETQLKISPGQSWTTLHCQNDRLGALDRT